MDGSKHLIMIAHRIPYPPNKGDKIRSFNHIKYLYERGWHIHLCTHVDDSNDLQYKNELEKYCKTVTLHPISKVFSLAAMGLNLIKGMPLSVSYFYSKTIQKKVDELLNDYPVESVFCFSSPTAEYLFRSNCIQKQKPGCVMDLIDVDSLKWKQYAKQKSGLRSLIYCLEGKLLSKYEKKIINQFDAVILVSPDEVKALNSSIPNREIVHAIGNGVDLEFFKKKIAKHIKKRAGNITRLVFFGRMDYYPNEDAVIWFTKEVLPLIQKEADVLFCIVGACPSQKIISLSRDPFIEVTGEVDDIRPYVWDADICVFPIRIARGIQNKILEAMSMGKAIVSSLQAFEGIEAEPGKDLIAVDTEPEVFAKEVIDMCKNPERSEKLSLNAYDCVHRKYSWNSRLQPLDKLLTKRVDI